MEPLTYHLKYTGREASKSRLPAHAGSQSLEGITWSLSLIGNYLATGQIRKRGKLDDRIKFYLLPPKSGSFAADICAFITEPQSLFITSIVGSYAVSTATSAINAFVKYSFRKVCGFEEDASDNEYATLSSFPSGDLEANLDSIEPSMIRAHSAIGLGATQLSVSTPGKTIVSLNDITKSYIKSNIESDNIEDLSASIGALNVNTGNGRAYIEDIDKTVAFQSSKSLT